jgi:hypothetical protein
MVTVLRHAAASRPSFAAKDAASLEAGAISLSFSPLEIGPRGKKYDVRKAATKRPLSCILPATKHKTASAPNISVFAMALLLVVVPPNTFFFFLPHSSRVWNRNNPFACVFLFASSSRVFQCEFRCIMSSDFNPPISAYARNPQPSCEKLEGSMF